MKDKNSHAGSSILKIKHKKSSPCFSGFEYCGTSGAAGIEEGEVQGPAQYNNVKQCFEGVCLQRRIQGVGQRGPVAPTSTFCSSTLHNFLGLKMDPGPFFL